jgi:hypothetical protein
MTESSTPLSPVSSVAGTPPARRVAWSEGPGRGPPGDARAMRSEDERTETTTWASTELSRLGELMSRLQDLAEAHPAQAHGVLAAVATALGERARHAGDPRLQVLADTFSHAAGTGDLSALEPSGSPIAGTPPSVAEPALYTTSATQSGRIARYYAQSASDPTAELVPILERALAELGEQPAPPR